MNPDELHLIDELSPAALLSLIQRIEASRTLEQMIYRESEIDEVWRLLDEGAVVDAIEAGRLAELRSAVMEAHDLLGVDENAPAAARRLREAIG